MTDTRPTTQGRDTPSSAGRRAALYVRVSTEEQARHGLSVDEQEHALREYAAAHGLSVVGLYTDEGTSARKTLSRRKALQALLQDVKADLIDVILFIKLDRWFRNIADYYKIQAILDQHHVDWKAILEDYDTSTSTGRLNLNIRLSIAQNESDQTSDRIKFVFEAKKRRHEALTGQTPFGYSIVDKHFVPNDDAPKILDLFEYFATHPVIIDTLAYAREKYGLEWRRVSLRRAFANPSYVGTFYGIEQYAPAIVPQELFDHVQDILEHNSRHAARKRSSRIYLFTGLIRCPVCGRVLTGTRGHRAKDGTFKHPFYRCAYHNIEKSCSWKGRVFEATLEKYLLFHLKAAITDFAVDLEKKKSSTTSDAAARKVRTIRDKLTRLKELYVDGCIDRETYNNDFKRLNDELTAALKTEKTIARPMPQALKALLSLDLNTMYDQLSQKDRHNFWHAILAYIDITHYEKGFNKRKEFAIHFRE